MIPKNSIFRRHSTALLWVLAVLVIVGALVVPSADVMRKGRHLPVQLHRTISSDGRYEVTTSSRVKLPAFSVMDPPSIATFTLRETSGGKTLASEEVEMAKESDLGNPLVMWNGGEVRVTAFDVDQQRSVTLRVPANAD